MSGAARGDTAGRRINFGVKPQTASGATRSWRSCATSSRETAAKSPTAALVTRREQTEIKRRRIGPDQQLCCRDKRSQTQFLEASKRDYTAGWASSAGNVLAGPEGRKTSRRMCVSSLLRIASAMDSPDCIPNFHRRFLGCFHKRCARFRNFVCDDYNPRPQILRHPRIREQRPRTSI